MSVRAKIDEICVEQTQVDCVGELASDTIE